MNTSSPLKNGRCAWRTKLYAWWPQVFEGSIWEVYKAPLRTSSFTSLSTLLFIHIFHKNTGRRMHWGILFLLNLTYLFYFSFHNSFCCSVLYNSIFVHISSTFSWNTWSAYFKESCNCILVLKKKKRNKWINLF